MQPQVGDAQALGVERAHDLRQVAHPARKLHGDAPGGRRCLLTEPTERLQHPIAVAGVRRRGFDAGPSDRVLELGRSSLRHDPAAIDDPDAVGQHIGLLEVLRGEEHRDAVRRQPAHLIPERGTALRVKAGGGLV